MTVSLVCRLGQILGNPKNHWKNFQPITPLCTLKEKIKPYDESWGHRIHNVYYEFVYGLILVDCCLWTDYYGDGLRF